MLHIVIPMAGLGSRFANEGYSAPKPFIEFEGAMMIEHVLRGLKVDGAKYTLIIRGDFKENYPQQLSRLQNNFDVNIITDYGVTKGAACTAIAAHKCINPDDSVLFADSDNIFQSQDIKNLLSSVKNLDAALLTVNASSPAYSYAKINDYGYVTQTREKEVISNHAITGVYYFAKMRDFVDAAICMILHDDAPKGEFYMSNVYNYLVRSGGKIGIHEISNKRFTCVGTPRQLKEYIDDKT